MLLLYFKYHLERLSLHDMPLIINAPPPAAATGLSTGHRDHGERPKDLEGDVDMLVDSTSKHPDLASKNIITPGEIVTDDPQWMR